MGMIYRMSLKKLSDLLKAGVGTGIGDLYIPWITVTKKNTTTKSNQSITKMPGLERHCHFLSRAEKHMAHILWWAGASDVREQFPLFPWPHPNPKSALNFPHNYGEHPGLNSIAEDAGIRIPNYPKIKLPWVLTLDLMVTTQWPDGSFKQLIGISCKPMTELLLSEKNLWTLQRLELDRRYCKEAGISHLLAHAEKLPPAIGRELEWLAPAMTTKQLNTKRLSCEYKYFVEKLSTNVYDTPASIAANLAAHSLGWSNIEIGEALRTAIWCQDVDVDISQRLNLAAPLKRGGHAIRAMYRERLLGLKTND